MLSQKEVVEKLSLQFTVPKFYHDDEILSSAEEAPCDLQLIISACEACYDLYGNTLDIFHHGSCLQPKASLFDCL